MIITRILAIVLAIWAMLPHPAIAGSSLKIGYFDMQAVLNQSKWGKKAKAEFKEKQALLKAKVEAKAKEFQKQKETFEKKQALLSESAKQKEIEQLRRARLEGEQLLFQTNAELNKLSKQLMAPIVNKVAEIVKKLGKKDGYDFIFEVQESGLFYAKPDADLTKTIIKELDKVTPQ